MSESLTDLAAMQRLQKLEERFRRVVEFSPIAKIMINQRGIIEMINMQTERLFGYERSEMLGQSIEMLLPERFRALHPQLRQSFFTETQSRPMGAGRDLYARRKDGSEFPVEIGLNPIETDEGPMVLSAIVDISDRHQKEMHIRAALQEKELLLGEIHHRVKNNLQVIDSLLDMQAARIDDPKTKEVLLDSQNRVRSMALIHQTLYQSHDFARVNFGEIVDSLVPTLVSSYGLDTDNLHLVINADAVHLPINLAIPCGLIINELVTNALKYAFPNGRAGVITVKLSPLQDERVELVVGDDGVGIPESLNVETTNTLGLQLVQLLASQVNGELTIQRCPAQFTLTFALPAGSSSQSRQA
ncbi:MAG: histidine kinase dimerization/phosphoacceptor domain -containing protein [Spongiibacteraceae bacterium]